MCQQKNTEVLGVLDLGIERLKLLVFPILYKIFLGLKYVRNQLIITVLSLRKWLILKSLTPFLVANLSNGNPLEII